MQCGFEADKEEMLFFVWKVGPRRGHTGTLRKLYSAAFINTLQGSLSTTHWILGTSSRNVECSMLDIYLERSDYLLEENCEPTFSPCKAADKPHAYRFRCLPRQLSERGNASPRAWNMKENLPIIPSWK